MSRAVTPDNAGLLQYRQARSTGTHVSIYDNAKAGLDDEDGEMPFSTVCEDHGGVINHRNITKARDWAPAPEEWCPSCQKLARGLCPCECAVEDIERPGLCECGHRMTDDDHTYADGCIRPPIVEPPCPTCGGPLDWADDNYHCRDRACGDEFDYLTIHDQELPQ